MKGGFVMTEEKKKVMEVTTQDFTKLDAENKMFILGYMQGVQQEKECKENKGHEPQIA